MLSHLLLDLLTHNGDIALGPYPDAPKYGTFLYGRLALLAFVVELAYGLNRAVSEPAWKTKPSWYLVATEEFDR